MDRREFTERLRAGLSGLPEEDIERSVEYYEEIIDDRMEDGTDEREAVAALGPVEDIVSQILLDTPLPKLVKARVAPKRKLSVWEIVLLVVGSPVWAPLLIAAAAVVFAVYVVLWSVVVCLFAADLSLAAGAVTGIGGAMAYLRAGNIPAAAFSLGAGLVCAGLCALFFFVCTAAAKGAVSIGKRIILGVKACFIRKGDAK